MFKIIYIVLYVFFISISIGVFFIFKPFQYIDNQKSYLICTKDQSRFEIGPNLIYAFSRSLDSYNDKKARKLCEYKTIRDYADSQKTPETVNYKFYPVYTNESSWLNAIQAGVYTFIVLAFLIELTKKFIL